MEWVSVACMTVMGIVCAAGAAGIVFIVSVAVVIEQQRPRIRYGIKRS